MDSFLGQMAQALYAKYGDGISSLDIIFPSRRAGLFFADALSRIIEKPLWQPRYTSIDETIEEIAGIASGDRIRLVTELYKVYSKYHEESFDSFYFWGETLLSDFDSIDKYLIDADMLFANISDLKTLENNFNYLSEDQRLTISRFWKSFGDRDAYSDEQQRFMSVWNTLARIYHDFRANLNGLGIAYTGMVYRAAVEKIRAGKAACDQRKHYVVAGFNALSQCEKVLFDHLARAHDVDFFWDYDKYYLDSPEQEAGLFLRENVERYPQRISLPHSYESFSGSKNITVVSTVSDSMQCKYIADYISETEGIAGRKPDKETAIVLTDENLLVPALHSIPTHIDRINVTMGYPLKLTLEYSFVERLIGLHARSKMRNDRTLYYHDDVKGLLGHPYILEKCGSRAESLSAELSAGDQVYVDTSEWHLAGFPADIFASPTTDWKSLAQYLKHIVSQVVVIPTDASGAMEAYTSAEASDASRKQRIEFFTLIVTHIDKLVNSLMKCGIELSEKIFASLLRRVLQSVSIPYEGEPLQGVQVMGILETRNLDFENVLLLSMNEDNFPGNMSNSASFIPYNLRVAYGLPTPQHHEGVYAYYFYRLLQRAKNIHLVYSARSDEKSSGEQSRYIYQLDYESPHTIKRREMTVSVNLGGARPITVEKTDELSEFLYPDGRKLSPTSLYRFIKCPLQFYFHSVARLETEKEVSEDIDMPMFGTILHKAMELLYRPLVGSPDAREAIRKLIGTSAVEASVEAAIREEYFKGGDTEAGNYSGNLLYVRDIILRYINGCILPYDAAQDGFTVTELERKLESGFEFQDADCISRTAYFRGYADRVDTMADGTRRIVDYKTGKDNREFKGLESLFSEEDYGSAPFQAMIYAMIYNRRHGTDVRPALYFVRQLNAPDYSALLFDKEAQVPVDSYITYKQEFEGLISQVLSRLFDSRTPFTQCGDSKTCRHCDFNVVCKR